MGRARELLAVLDAIDLEGVHLRYTRARDERTREVGLAAAQLGHVYAFQRHQRLEESDLVGDELHQRFASYQKPASLRLRMPPGLVTRIFATSHNVCHKENVSVFRADVVTASRKATKRP